MSMSEVERFSQDLKENEELSRDFSEGLVGLEEIVRQARARGYDFELEEASSYMGWHHFMELSQDELKMAAGGCDVFDPFDCDGPCDPPIVIPPIVAIVTVVVQ